MAASHDRALPRVIINMAMSVDGKVSSRSREPTTFTSAEDKRRLLEIRALCDALVIGARTAAIERTTMSIPNAKLRATRLRRGQAPHPVRVIVSGRLTLSPDLPVFKRWTAPLILACTEAAPRSRRERFTRLAEVIVCGRREVDLKRLIQFLARRYRVRSILCEGGPTLNDAFFRAGVVHELYLTLCPRLVGGRQTPTLVDGQGFARLKDAARGRLIECRKGKEEWFFRYRFKRSSMKTVSFRGVS